MNILCVASRFPSHIRTGDRLRVYYLAREFARAGHVVDLVGYDDPNAPLETEIAAHCRRMERIPMEDIEFRRTHRPKDAFLFLRASIRGYPHRVERLRTERMPAALRGMIADGDYDVVQFSEEIVGSAFESVAAQLGSLGIPVVYDFIDAMSCSVLRSLREGISLLAPAQAVSGLLLRRYELRLIRSVQAATLVSERDRRALGSPPGLSVIPNGVDIPPAGAAVERDIDVLFVGNFESASNRDGAIWFLRTVLPALHALRPGSTATIVGPHPPERILRHRSAAVTVTGEVASTADYYRRAKLAVAPIRFGAGIKNKILEAFASGVPVVATSEANEGIDAPAEAIAIADDPLPMARDIAALLDDAPRRQAMADCARRFVQRTYSWESAARAYLELYDAASRECAASRKSSYISGCIAGIHQRNHQLEQ